MVLPLEKRLAKKRLVAVGAVCETSIYRVAAVPAPPAKALASDAARVADGMAISAAYSFAKLGGHAAAWARVGKDARGDAIRDELGQAGLDVSEIRSVAVGRSLPTSDLKAADFVLADVRWVEGAEAVLAAARAQGVPAMLDADVGPREILARLVPLAAYAVFSDAGLFAYTGLDALEPALRAVAATHTGHVGASCGADGYFWLEDGAMRHVPALAVDVVDTLSAGDVFHGAMALGLAEGMEMARAARFACVAASLKCRHFGGRLGCPTRAEVDAAL